MSAQYARWEGATILHQYGEVELDLAFKIGAFVSYKQHDTTGFVKVRRLLIYRYALASGLMNMMMVVLVLSILNMKYWMKF
jgi:hypothetical protein